MIGKTILSVTHHGDCISIRFTDDTLATVRRQNPAMHNLMGSELTLTIEHPQPFLMMNHRHSGADVTRAPA